MGIFLQCWGGVVENGERDIEAVICDVWITGITEVYPVCLENIFAWYLPDSVNMFGLLLFSCPLLKYKLISKSKFFSGTQIFYILGLDVSLSLMHCIILFLHKPLDHLLQFESLKDSCPKSVVFKAWGSLSPFQGVHEVKTIFIMPRYYLLFSTFIPSWV